MQVKFDYLQNKILLPNCPLLEGAQIYNVTPVAKPRMTQRDKWKKRAVVQRYWGFKDAVRASGLKIPRGGSHVIFLIPLPKSVAASKRIEFYGHPHLKRPDVDNLLKGLLDALFEEDREIWDIRSSKIWWPSAGIALRNQI